ncbi:MAG: MGMT family protein [Candidatus Micrarchaeaceae archaeon]
MAIEKGFDEKQERTKLAERLKKAGLTEFQVGVLLETLSIPRGKTMTYKQMAYAVGHPNAYRAVGTALKLNPFPIAIPCHRVIKSDGRIGNYSYGGSKRKAILLKMEHAI